MKTHNDNSPVLKDTDTSMTWSARCESSGRLQVQLLLPEIGIAQCGRPHRKAPCPIFPGERF
jgi:hypothetical protein